MNIWMWLIVGFLTGLVVAAIINLIFRSGSSTESEPAQSNLSADLAKSKVKVTVLEDKLRQAEADNLAMRADLEADCKEQLAAIEADYRVQLAIMESERNSVPSSLFESQSEVDIDWEIDQQDEEIDDGLEDLILLPETDVEDNLLDNPVDSAAIVAAAIIAQDVDSKKPDTAPDDVEEIVDIVAVDEIAAEESSTNSEMLDEAADEANEVTEGAAANGDESVDSDFVQTSELAAAGNSAADSGELAEDDSEISSGTLAAAVIGAAAIGAVANSEDEENKLPEFAEAAGIESIVDEDSDEQALESDDLTAELADVETQNQDLERSQPMDDIEPTNEVDEVVDLDAVTLGAAGAVALSETIDDVEDTGIEQENAKALEDEVAESSIDNEQIANESAEEGADEKEIEPVLPAWPDDNSVWRGEYFNNMTLDGTPVMIREDTDINFDWGFGSPAPEINVDQFSVRWTRKAEFPPGLYRFTVTSDDGVRLWVNERLVISAWYDHSQMTFRREMELPGGAVNLRLEYYENDMAALAKCSWERIG